MAKEPVSLQLCYLQTLTEIGAEKNTTVVFPLPMELTEYFIEMKNKIKAGNNQP